MADGLGVEDVDDAEAMQEAIAEPIVAMLSALEVCSEGGADGATPPVAARYDGGGGR